MCDIQCTIANHCGMIDCIWVEILHSAMTNAAPGLRGIYRVAGYRVDHSATLTAIVMMSDVTYNREHYCGNRAWPVLKGQWTVDLC